MKLKLQISIFIEGYFSLLEIRLYIMNGAKEKYYVHRVI